MCLHLSQSLPSGAGGIPSRATDVVQCISLVQRDSFFAVVWSCGLLYYEAGWAAMNGRTVFKCINVCTHTHIYEIYIYIYAEGVQKILYLCKKENPEQQGLQKVLFKKESFLL